MHAQGFIEELSGENDDLVFVFRESLNLDGNIGDVAEDVLHPGFVRVEATLGVLEPEELTFASFHVRASSDEILTSISVEIDPVAHMIEVVVLLGSDLFGLNSLGEIVGVHADDVNATVFLGGHEETVRDDDGALTEDILGDDLDVVGPLEARGIQFHGLELGGVTGDDGVLDARNHVDGTRAHGTEGGDEHEIFAILELRHVEEGSILYLELAFRGELEVSLGADDGSKRGSGESLEHYFN